MRQGKESTISLTQIAVAEDPGVVARQVLELVEREDDRSHRSGQHGDDSQHVEDIALAEGGGALHGRPRLTAREPREVGPGRRRFAPSELEERAREVRGRRDPGQDRDDGAHPLLRVARRCPVRRDDVELRPVVSVHRKAKLVDDRSEDVAQRDIHAEVRPQEDERRPRA